MQIVAYVLSGSPIVGASYSVKFCLSLPDCMIPKSIRYQYMTSGISIEPLNSKSLP
jgi:hypothetical protein